MSDDKRDEIADAIRARQSLEHDGHPDVALAGQAVTGNVSYSDTEDPEVEPDADDLHER